MEILTLLPLQNIYAFISHLFAGGLVLFIFTYIYINFTPYKELDLIKTGNSAAAISLIGAMLGFAIPVASVISNSHLARETFIWSIVALIVQLGVFIIVRFFMRDISTQIIENRISSGIFLGGISLIVGILTAASLNG
jgi:putative membrane protein